MSLAGFVIGVAIGVGTLNVPMGFALGVALALLFAKTKK